MISAQSTRTIPTRGRNQIRGSKYEIHQFYCIFSLSVIAFWIQISSFWIRNSHLHSSDIVPMGDKCVVGRWIRVFDWEWSILHEQRWIFDLKWWIFYYKWWMFDLKWWIFYYKWWIFDLKWWIFYLKWWIFYLKW